jgi:Tfp pilus assembly protein PilW
VNPIRRSLARRLARRLDHRLAGADRQAGMTVVELSVSMVITAILLACVATVTITTMNSTRTMNSRSNASADGRIALETISRTLRAAAVPSGEPAAVTVATATQLTFYSQINRPDALVFQSAVVPSRIEYSQSGGCLREAFTPARVITGAGGATSFAWDTGRTVKCVLRTDTDATLFTYFGSATTATALTPLLLDKVQSIELDLTVVDPDNTGAGGVPMKTRVTLDNVVLQAGGSV